MSAHCDPSPAFQVRLPMQAIRVRKTWSFVRLHMVVCPSHVEQISYMPIKRRETGGMKEVLHAIVVSRLLLFQDDWLLDSCLKIVVGSIVTHWSYTNSIILFLRCLLNSLGWLKMIGSWIVA